MAQGESLGQERTEQPTAKRREDARRRGQVLKSPDLTAAVALLGAVGIYSMTGPRLVADATGMVSRSLSSLPTGDLTPGEALALFFEMAGTIARLGWPLVAVPAVAAIGVQLLQTRFALSWRAAAPQWERIHPGKGFARLVSGQGAFEALKTMVKIVALGTIAYSALRADWPRLLAGGQGSAGLLATLGGFVRDLWLSVAGAYLALAALDLGSQWWRHQKSLRMTHEEVRQENRESEGDPQLKSRIRGLQRQRAMRRMMAEVKRADVVLRNPTHVAVALRYESGAMRAPRVVAKGARLLALRMVRIARREGVPVVENPPLARALYRLVPVGREVPAALYRAVAEVLAYVYALRSRRPR